MHNDHVMAREMNIDLQLENCRKRFRAAAAVKSCKSRESLRTTKCRLHFSLVDSCCDADLA
jgi:hypothetical protein